MSQRIFFCLIFCFLFCFPLLAENEVETAKRLPEDTLFLLTVPDAKKSFENSKELWIAKLWNDEDVQTFVTPLVNALEKEISKELAGGQDKMPEGLKRKALVDAVKALDGNITFAILKFPPKGKELPDMILSLESSKIETVDVCFQALLGLAEKEEDTAVSDFTLGGLKGKAMVEKGDTVGKDDTLFYLKSDKRIYVGTEKDSLESFISGNQTGSNLAQNKNFTTGLLNTGTGELSAFLNLIPIFKTITDENSPYYMGREAKMFKALKVDDLKSVSASLQFDKNYLVSKKLCHRSRTCSKPYIFAFKSKAKSPKTDTIC